MSASSTHDSPHRQDGVHLEDMKYVLGHIGFPSRIFSFYATEEEAKAKLEKANFQREDIQYEVMTWDAYCDAAKTYRLAHPAVNSRGNTLFQDEDADLTLGLPHFPRDGDDGDRYWYDERLIGWRQYDTNQDAAYFGMWVNLAEFKTFTYCEGDRTLVICSDAAHLKAELNDAERIYGPPPPFAVGYDMDGTKTEFYDIRPTV